MYHVTCHPCATCTCPILRVILAQPSQVQYYVSSLRNLHMYHNFITQNIKQTILASCQPSSRLKWQTPQEQQQAGRRAGSVHLMLRSRLQSLHHSHCLGRLEQPRSSSCHLLSLSQTPHQRSRHDHERKHLGSLPPAGYRCSCTPQRPEANETSHADGCMIVHARHVTVSWYN